MACKIEILCIGNELLIGKTFNTNAHWLSQKITKIGADVARITIVNDDSSIIASTLKEILTRKPDFVLTSGGLGPTFDDKTLQGFSKAFGRRLHLDKTALRHVNAKYHKIFDDKPPQLTKPRLKMAMLPTGSKSIPNPIGTAPAVMLIEKDVKFFILPGVPVELQAIFNQSIQRQIKKKVGKQFFYETSIVLSGLLESQIAPIIDQVIKAVPEVYIKSHAKDGEGTFDSLIELHFSIRGSNNRTIKQKVMNAVTLMCELIGRSKITRCSH